MKIKNKFAAICIIFTIITVVTSFFSIGKITHLHIILRFVVIAIGTISFYLFQWLEHWPLRFVQILHYIISIGLVFTFAWLTDKFVDPVAPRGYYELFWSYTAVYIIIAMINEIKMRFDIKKQNKLLKEITNNKL